MILKQYQELLNQVDAWFAGAQELYPDKISCRSGCSDCCRGLFDITILDAWQLKQGFDALPLHIRTKVAEKCRERLAGIRALWPEFDRPYLLNCRPEEDWDAIMPEDDETPCVLLGEDGRCLVYRHRPLTCRLHGIPQIDLDGEQMSDEWCTLNFAGEEPMELPGLRAPFTGIFRQEVSLLVRFTEKLLHRGMGEVDTVIPAALLMDFDNFDWPGWLGNSPLAAGKPPA